MGGLELLLRGVVGGEHDSRLPGDAAALRHHQLRHGGAVAAAALLVEQLQNGGGGSGLDGEVLPEAWIPGKGGLQAAGVLPDALLVVDMKGVGYWAAMASSCFFATKGVFISTASNLL